jgi:hypothetical protein
LVFHRAFVGDPGGDAGLPHLSNQSGEIKGSLLRGIDLKAQPRWVSSSKTL